jgi:hypothetical protein
MILVPSKSAVLTKIHFDDKYGDAEFIRVAFTDLATAELSIRRIHNMCSAAMADE